MASACDPPSDRWTYVWRGVLVNALRTDRVGSWVTYTKNDSGATNSPAATSHAGGRKKALQRVEPQPGGQQGRR